MGVAGDLSIRACSALDECSVTVEELETHKNGMHLGDSEWSVVPYNSVVGHLGAT
jgi:hypothetical protein